MLDAKSAFDKILAEFIIRNAFLAGSRGQGLLYLADRLTSRLTYVEWDKCLMGPIKDLLGVEQGGVLSDRLYKLANNEQLSTTQESKLGLHMNGVVVSSIGQADDAFLVTAFSNCNTSSTLQLSTVLSTMWNWCQRRPSCFAFLLQVLSQQQITGNLYLRYTWASRSLGSALELNMLGS